MCVGGGGGGVEKRENREQVKTRLSDVFVC